jgi:hypothetical protein
MDVMSTGQHPPNALGDFLKARRAQLSPGGSGQRLMVLSAEPGAPSHERLRILLSWNAAPHAGLGTDHPPAREAETRQPSIVESSRR